MANIPGDAVFICCINPRWRPIIAGAQSVAQAISFDIGICLSLKTFSTVLKIVEAFVSAVKDSLNNNSSRISSFLLR